MIQCWPRPGVITFETQSQADDYVFICSVRVTIDMMIFNLQIFNSLWLLTLHVFIDLKQPSPSWVS